LRRYKVTGQGGPRTQQHFLSKEKDSLFWGGGGGNNTKDLKTRGKGIESAVRPAYKDPQRAGEGPKREIGDAAETAW